ncbi:MAG TPA: hypothetical protein VFG42_13885 [Baekduia sp.]|uniref:hypothetical protein n=1 Tax=Baekduia sp. TaxID=2600305 RepID=UPI002D78B7F8|nr:hypothetical protein [Baekduia sp.]HET6507875.1 hypothetical protein [Baekduia sp.]
MTRLLTIALACDPGGACWAAGYNANDAVLVRVSHDGVPGTPIEIADMAAVDDLSCPTAGFCEAVGGSLTTQLGTVVFSLTNGSVGDRHLIAGRAARRRGHAEHERRRLPGRGQRPGRTSRGPSPSTASR